MRLSGNMFQQQKYYAFSMAEIILVIGIFVIVIAVALPLGLSSLERENQQGQILQLESDIFAQQQNAFTGKDSGNHGVKIGTNSYWLYEGPSYASATSSREVILTRGATFSSVNLSTGSDEILFTSGDLAPMGFGSISIEDQTRFYRLEINVEGLLDTIITTK